ncbi:unnamed protein product [Schistocephalus solidus]|uniref:Uncharacterized protein n=1 Tax=Schistocephalus solidus TaxID=70667 RepID=A0A183TKV6_SCHSO|nr:unnamed protein product [Schistocephalus solidus]
MIRVAWSNPSLEDSELKTVPGIGLVTPSSSPSSSSSSSSSNSSLSSSLQEIPTLNPTLTLELALTSTPKHGMDAKDSGPLQDFRVRDPVMPSQLQYSVEAAEMEVIQLPALVRVDGPGFRSVKECRQDDGLEHHQFCVQLNTVAILHGGLQPAIGLTGFGDPLGNLIIDYRVS